MDDPTQLSDDDLDARIQQNSAAVAEMPVPKGDPSKLSDEDLDARIAHGQAALDKGLAPVREFVQKNLPEEEPTGTYLGRNIGKTAFSAITNYQYGRAKQSLDAGKATDADLQTIAEYEHLQGWKQKAASTIGGVAAETALNLPETAAQFMAGGAALKAAGMAGATTLAGKIGQGVAMTPAVPSLYLDRWQQNNIQAGRNPQDVRGLPNAMATAAVQVGLLETLGPVAKGLFPEAATNTLVKKMGTEALAGGITLPVGEYGTYVLGLTEHGGPIQDAMEGKWSDVAKGSVANLILAGGLAAIHGGPEAGKKVVENAQASIQADIRRGMNPESAIQKATAKIQPPPEAPPPTLRGEGGNIAQDRSRATITPEAQTPAEGGDVPVAGQPAAEAPPAQPAAPQTPRERVDALEQTHLELTGKLQDAQRAEERAKQERQMGLGGSEAKLAEAVAERRGVEKSIRGLRKQLDAARVEAAGQEPEATKGAPFDQPSSLTPNDRGATPNETPETVAGPPPAPIDRRQDPARRARVAEMGPEELRRELLTSKLTDLPNRRAFDEADKSPVVGMSDADALKAFNDTFGYEAGDSLLRAKADALKAAGLDAYHEKGDEFLYRAQDSAELKGKLEKARGILRDSEIRVTMKDGSVRRFKGADFSYGVGNELKSAESGLKAHKALREAKGERARGELRGITEAGQVPGGEGGHGADPERPRPASEAGDQVTPITARGETPAEVADPKPALRKRLLEGDQRLTAADLEAAGLDPREAHVAVERLVNERDQSDLRADPVFGDRVYSRQRVEQIEKKAFAKLGIDKTAEEVIKGRTEQSRNERINFDRERERPLDAEFGEDGPDVALVAPLIKTEVLSGSRWRVDKLREVMGDFFTHAEIDAAFAEHKLPPRGKASDEAGGAMKGIHSQARAGSWKHDLRQTIVELLKGIAPKELADDVTYQQRRGKSRAEAEADIGAAVAEARQVAGAQSDPGEAAAEQGHSGDVGSFDPAQFGSPLSESEHGAIPGGGQPQAGERQLKTTALANAKVDQERQQAKLPPILSDARQENAAVWDKAMAKLDADPQAGARLVEELSHKRRATTIEENALLLQRRVALRNEYSRVAAEYARGMMDPGARDLVDFAALEAREADLAKQVDLTDRVARETGSEWGKAGQFRKQLAAEDYSLAGMLQKAAAAKKAPLTPAEKVQIFQLQEKIKELQGKLDAAEKSYTEAGSKVGSKAFGDMQKARVAVKGETGKFDEQIAGYREKNQTYGRKVADWLIKLRVNEVISSPITLAKIVAASAERVAIGPLEEAAGAVWSRIPGIAKIAAMAPREGRGMNTAAEKRAVASSFTEGLADAWRTIRTGKSDLDVLYGKGSVPRSWLDYQFSLHDAMKAPAVRAEYTRSFLKRLDFETAAGRDATSPAALLRIGVEAYKDAQSAKFRQENWLVDAVNGAIDQMRRPGASTASQVTGTMAKMLVPVVRIPTNLAFETGRYIFGTGTGAVQATRAWMKGLENLKPAEADAIMQQFKKGSLGMAALLAGYFNPQMFGGYYSGKRRDDDVKAGGARIGGADIPAWLQHNPLLQVFQFGATVARAEKAVSKGQQQGLAVGIGAGAAGLAEEVPFVRESEQIAGLTSHNARERGHFLGELVKSLAIPQAVQWLAGRTDLNPNGEVQKRKPTTVGQTIETGIPGLRQRVPVGR